MSTRSASCRAAARASFASRSPASPSPGGPVLCSAARPGVLVATLLGGHPLVARPAQPGPQRAVRARSVAGTAGSTYPPTPPGDGPSQPLPELPVEQAPDQTPRRPPGRPPTGWSRSPSTSVPTASGRSSTAQRGCRTVRLNRIARGRQPAAAHAAGGSSPWPNPRSPSVAQPHLSGGPAPSRAVPPGGLLRAWPDVGHDVPQDLGPGFGVVVAGHDRELLALLHREVDRAPVDVARHARCRGCARSGPLSCTRGRWPRHAGRC